VSASAELSEWIRRATGAQSVELTERLQRLWGGYGELLRVRLSGADFESAVVKSVTPPRERALAQDAAAQRSHRRKLRSYAVEQAFYRTFAQKCDAACRVPAFHLGEARAGGFWLLLEDLDRAGWPLRRTRCSAQEIEACLAWLAAFHARFLGSEPTGLWPVGSYWHLATRPDELARLNDSKLQRAARVIDQRLNTARFKTLVHGDAKLENFCFATLRPEVAAVDFQYVGGGVGVKDVAYFFSSSLSPAECHSQVPGYLDFYFQRLRTQLDAAGTLCDSELAALEREWRTLFSWAWADFHRFLLGWAPGEGESDSYGRKQLELVLNELR